MPQDLIAAVEEGTEKPTLDALEAWAGALGVGMHELFLTGGPSPSPEQKDGHRQAQRTGEEAGPALPFAWGNRSRQFNLFRKIDGGR